MMHKDQLYGGIIFVVAIIIINFFNLWLFGVIPNLEPIWVVDIVVWLLVMLVLGIAGWIGWTMASTPPPKPIEELTAGTGPEPTPSPAKADEKASQTKKP